MYVFSFLRELFTAKAVFYPTAFAATALIVSFAVGLFTGKGELYPAFAIPFGGACFLLVLCADGVTGTGAAAFGGVYIVTGGAVGLLLRFFLAIRVARRRRREGRKAWERRAVFTLPERENTFLRDRLNGPLKPQESGAPDFDPTEAKLELSHARKLLSKVKAAKLTPADRLETQALSRRLTGYADKERLSKEEVSALNDCLLELLKTAAKYAV